MCHICDEGGVGPCGKAAEVARLDMQDLSQQYTELQSETTLTESFEAHVNKDGADISKCPFLNNIGFAAVQLASSPEQMQSESRGPSIKELLAEKRRQKAELQVIREEPTTINDRLAPVIAEIDQAMTENIQTLSQARALVEHDQSEQVVVQKDPEVPNITAFDELIMREQQQSELLSVAVPDLAPRKIFVTEAILDEFTVPDVISDLPSQSEITPDFSELEELGAVIEQDTQLPIEVSISPASDQVAEVSFIAPEIETEDLVDDVHVSAEHTVITVLPEAPISLEEPIVTSNEMNDHESIATELLTESLPDEVKVPLEQFVSEIIETEPTFSESMIEVLSIIESLAEDDLLSDTIENIIVLKEEVAQLLDVDSELLSDAVLRQVLLTIQKQLEIESKPTLFDIAYRNRVGTSEYRRVSMQFKSTNYARASRYLLALVRNQPVLTLQTA